MEGLSLVLLLSILCGVFPASAQRHETFSVHPGKRNETALRARENGHREKNAAREWAVAHGIPMRVDNGTQVRELMAVRGGRPIFYTTLNYNAAISTAADQVRDTAPFEVDGEGVTVGVWDVGAVISTHVEFSGGRVTVADGASSHYHSTHVGGTIAAGGTNFMATGMAPASHILSYDWDDDEPEMIIRAASYPGEPGKIYLSNHSYGYTCGWVQESESHFIWYGDGWSASAADNQFGRYVDEASRWDEIVYEAPYYLPFKAAGNDRNDNPSTGDTVQNGILGSSTAYDPAVHPKGDGRYDHGGYDTILPVCTAKNIISVGAVRDAVSGINRSLVNAGMTDFSNWGPADDGRIKPDIVANGYFVTSCDNSSNTAYMVRLGTSMASPNACGSAALLVAYYAVRFPDEAMRASTLKGLILHTADDLGRPGPDYCNGWGLMNTREAAELIRDYADGNALRMTESYLDDLKKSEQLTFYVDGSTALRATLCWTDPPSEGRNGLDDRTPVLINDLDLKIIGPGGTNFPYSLSYTEPEAVATTLGENTVDNVEQVYIDAPTPGVYTVIVDYDEALLTDGLQDYSLLISGTAQDSDRDGLPDGWESAFFASITGAVASMDSDGDGMDNLSEFVTGFDPTDSASVFRPLLQPNRESGGSPVVLTWNPVFGRSYSISWSTNLVSGPFIPLSEPLEYPANIYTDTVQRAGLQQFYRIDVQLDL